VVSPRFIHTGVCLRISLLFKAELYSIKCGSTLVYPVIHWSWILGELSYFGYWEKWCHEHGCRNTCVIAYFQSFCTYIPKSRIAGSDNNNSFNSLRNSHTSFHIGLHHFTFRLASIRFSISPHHFLFSIFIHIQEACLLVGFITHSFGQT
jgi:hypothetical protein